jgi:hypothetical protein
MTLDPIAVVSGLVSPPETAVEPAPADPLQSNDPEELRLAAERARELSLAAIDPATVDRLNEDAADLDDLADDIESKEEAAQTGEATGVALRPASRAQENQSSPEQPREEQRKSDLLA